MRKLGMSILAISLLFATAARADETEPRLGSRDPNITEALTLRAEIKTVDGSANETVVKLGECGSIKGPFVVYNSRGFVVYSLAEGETIGPTETCK